MNIEVTPPINDNIRIYTWDGLDMKTDMNSKI